MVEKAGFRGVLQAYRYCIPVGCCGGRLLRGKGLGSFYRNTNGFLDFVLGFPGWICGGIGRRFGRLLVAGAGCGELGTAGGVAGLVGDAGRGLGLGPEAIADSAGDGGGVALGAAAGLTVLLGACCRGDVCCCWHGLAFL